MKSVFIIQNFYRNLSSQLAELYSAANSHPDEIWVLSRETDFVPEDEKAITRLLSCSDGEQESWLQILCAQAAENPADLYFLPSDNEGRMIAARLSFRLCGTALSGVLTAKLQENEELLVTKLCYNGHMESSFKVKKFPVCLSTAASSESIEMSLVKPPGEMIYMHKTSDFIRPETEVTEMPSSEGLLSAKKIVAVGLGVKSPEHISKCRELADKLNASFAASRPVVMNGWVSEQALLGVSGNVVSPDICLALGVSGSSAFMVGIQDSGKIIAVNTDINAPIYRNSDLRAEFDCIEIVSEMLDVIDKIDREI